MAWNDVPEVEGDDVGGDEVDVALGVDGASVADGVGGAGFVGAGAEGLGTLDRSHTFPQPPCDI